MPTGAGTLTVFRPFRLLRFLTQKAHGPAKGAPFKAEVVRRARREVAKKVGIEAHCYRGTRHSIASQAINCGISLEVIGGMLGHKTRSSATGYAHLNNEALDQMLDRDAEITKSGPSVNRQQEANAPWD
jgi:integrase